MDRRKDLLSTINADHTGRQVDGQIDLQSGRQTNIDRLTHRQLYRQTDRQIDKNMYQQTDILHKDSFISTID